MAAIPLDLLDRIRELERQVRELAGRSQIRPALTQITRGQVSIGEGGSLRVSAPGGATTFYAGDIGRPRPDGTAQMGLTLSRDDGSVAMAVWAPRPDVQPRQSIEMWDREENTLLAEDALGGLARPYIPYPMPTPEDTLAWASTVSTSWTTLYRGHGHVQHPGLYAYVVAATGTTQIRLLVNGGQIGPESKAGAALEFRAPIGLRFGEVARFEVQARTTTENRPAGCSPRMLYGMRAPTT